jgi:hypothetical protein
MTNRCSLFAGAYSDVVGWLQNPDDTREVTLVCSDNWLEEEGWDQNVRVGGATNGIPNRDQFITIAQAFPQFFNNPNFPGAVPFYSDDYGGYYFTLHLPCSTSGSGVIAETLGPEGTGASDPFLPSVINICPSFFDPRTANGLFGFTGYLWFDGLTANAVNNIRPVRLCDSLSLHVCNSPPLSRVVIYRLIVAIVDDISA